MLDRRGGEINVRGEPFGDSPNQEPASAATTHRVLLGVILQVERCSLWIRAFLTPFLRGFEMGLGRDLEDFWCSEDKSGGVEFMMRWRLM